MLKKTGIRLLVLAAMISFFFVAQAQTEEQGWKKTITLPSGEVVCDLNGEWDARLIYNGEYKIRGFYRDIVKITQQGNSFEGIQMTSNQFVAKGTVVIEGELDKNGFKRLMYNGSGATRGPYEGKLSKEGNKIEFYKSNYFDMELTRK